MTKFLALLSLVALAACAQKTSPTLQEGYLATSACSQLTSSSTCTAASGCQWLETTVAPANGGASPGVCAAVDPCASLDKNACANNGQCAWSQAKALCPVGSNCADGGYCHEKGSDGSDCACVSPVVANSNGIVLPVECDCTGGGTGGSGGACTCNCPACLDGETCPPCDCDCNDGGSGCDTGTTCACACPACLDGESCPPCDCNCGNGGTVVPVTPQAACAAHTDEASCNADTANFCQYGAIPCTSNGNCSICNSSPPSTTVCNCPACPANSECVCGCDSSGGTAGSGSGSVDGGAAGSGSSTDGGTSTITCVPPPTPTPPSDGGVVCPAIACANQPVCPNGTATDASGCPTCTCL